MSTPSALDALTVADLRALSGLFTGSSPATLAPQLAPAASDLPERAVLVTTAHRGVFFGYARDTSGDTIALRAARNCLYWPRGTKGFLGLASDGPGEDARGGPAADIVLRDITCVATVTDLAAQRWEAAPWQS